MGSSAGGHLAALVSTYKEKIPYEDTDLVDQVSARPDATILCYTVCHYPDGVYIQSSGSFGNLMGAGKEDAYPSISPDLLVDENTPPAFLWHTSQDNTSVISSYLYAISLRKYNIPHELHVFPYGRHGLGLAAQHPHVGQWPELLKNWFAEMGWIQ